jgi:hypothetical protein
MYQKQKAKKMDLFQAYKLFIIVIFKLNLYIFLHYRLFFQLVSKVAQSIYEHLYLLSSLKRQICYLLKFILAITIIWEFNFVRALNFEFIYFYLFLIFN